MKLREASALWSASVSKALIFLCFTNKCTRELTKAAAVWKEVEAGGGLN